MKLDADEKELLESVERGEWKSALCRIDVMSDPSVFALKSTTKYALPRSQSRLRWRTRRLGTRGFVKNVQSVALRRLD
jgi:hypothetical protein